MKDYLHLYGGMAGGIALLALYIFGWGALQKCCGAELVETPQAVLIGDLPQTAHPVLIGDLPQTAHPVLIGDLQQPQPLYYMPQSEEQVVIGDCTYIVIAAGDWARWTNAVARLEAVAERRWANEHKTDAGRRAWHGALKEKRQTEDGRGIEYTYADGFTYTEEATAAPRVPPAVRRMRESGEKRPVAAPRAEVGNGIPARLKAKREAISARPAVREVTATFAPGGKVLKVEGK